MNSRAFLKEFRAGGGKPQMNHVLKYKKKSKLFVSVIKTFLENCIQKIVNNE